MSNSTTLVRTGYGRLSVAQTAGTGLPVVLLHGNSSSRRVFEKQLAAPIGQHYRMIAIDLPGHGQSEDASDPVRAYTLPGYAAAVREVLDQLEVEQAAVFGWSLGGHVAYELASSWQGVIGLATSGAPPLSLDPADLQAAFCPNPALPLLFKEALDESESAALATAIGGPDRPEFLLADLRRADGRARRLLLDSVMRGEAADERAFVAAARIPVAVLNGAEDRLVSADYMAGLSFASLWEGCIHRVPGAGHLPFLQRPRAVNALLLRFLRDLARAAAHQPKRTVPGPRQQRPVAHIA